MLGVPAWGLCLEYCRSSLTPSAADGPGRGSLAPRNWETFSKLSGFSTLVCNLLIVAQVKPFSSFEMPFPVTIFLPMVVVYVFTAVWKGLFWEGPRGHLCHPPAENRATAQGKLSCQAVLGISSEEVSNTCLGGLWHLIVFTVDLKVTLKELLSLMLPPHPLVLAVPSWAPLGSSGNSVPVLG